MWATIDDYSVSGLKLFQFDISPKFPDSFIVSLAMEIFTFVGDFQVGTG